MIALASSRILEIAEGLPTIQNQSASKYYGDALPHPRPVYSVTGISKELRISRIYR